MSTVRFFSHSTRFFRHHVPTEFVLLGIAEFLVLIASFYIGLQLRFGLSALVYGSAPYLSHVLVFSVVMQMSLIAFGAYQRRSRQTPNMLAVRVGSSLLLGMVLLSITFYFAPMFFLGRGALAAAVFVSFIGIMLVRLIFERMVKAYDVRLKVLVLGAGDTANLVEEVEGTNDMDGVSVVGYVSMPGDSENSRHTNIVNPSGSLINYVEEKDIDVIVLAMDERRKGLPVNDLLDCKMSGVEVFDLLTFFERYTKKIRLDIMNPSWLFLSDGFQVNNFRRMWKRLFDVAMVLIFLPVVLPAMLLVIVAIIIESKFKGSVLYRQTRVTESGRLFQIYKFRSMAEDAEKDGVARWASKGDSRITRVGSFLRKFRFDELPQLYNVLKGDMSFVGPRPERPEFVSRLSDKIPYYNERHRVKPGLTGWAQVRYPYGGSDEDGLEKLQYDLYYVKNYSFILDALVLLQTIEVVLLGKGAQ